MSHRTVTIALLPTLLLGFVCAYLYSELQGERERARTESALRSDLQGRVANLDATRAELERELASLRLPSDETGLTEAPRVPRSPDVTTPPARVVEMSDANGMAVGPSTAQLEWMTSPIARDLMRSHQREWIRRSHDDLFKLLELSPVDAKALIALMVDAEYPALDLGTTRPIDPATLEKARNKIDEQRRKSDQAIRELLGEEKYSTYQDYRNTDMERTQVAELQRLFEATAAPLRAEQSAELLAALIEERATVPPWTRTPYTPTEEDLQRYQEWATEYEVRVQERIVSLLSPEQLERYNAYRRMQDAMRGDAISGGVAIQGGIAFSSSAVAVPE
jgi:hypothetical protein